MKVDDSAAAADEEEGPAPLTEGVCGCELAVYFAHCLASSCLSPTFSVSISLRVLTLRIYCLDLSASLAEVSTAEPGDTAQATSSNNVLLACFSRLVSAHRGVCVCVCLRLCVCVFSEALVRMVCVH